MKRRPIPPLSVVAANWVMAMQECGPKYTAGTAAAVAAGINPGQLAAANQAGYLAGVQQNVQKWATKVAAVPPANWAALCSKLGAHNIGPGAAAKVQKYQNGMQIVLQTMTTLKAQIAAMPKNTYAARKARMNAWADGLHALRTAAQQLAGPMMPAAQ